MKINRSALLLIGLSALGRASTTPDPALIAKASALLTHADELLLAVPTLEASYTQIDAYPGKFRDLRQTGTVFLAHPNELHVEIVRARRIQASDPWKDSGNNTLEVSGPSGQYAVFFHPHSTQVRKVDPAKPPNLSEAPALNGFFSGTNTPASILNSAASQGSVEDVQVEGNEVHFTIGKTERTVDLGADGLVHRVVARNISTQETRTWTLDRISVGKPIASSRFAYTPPSDALPYDKPDRGEALEAGDTAPDFTVPDYKGATVSLGDFKGKVVILKFWATWCWPCNQSLPETEALAAKYQGQGVEAVAVAIKDSKAGFAAWIKKHPSYKHIRFAFEDPLKPTISTAYRLRTQPTVFVITKSGKVTAEFEGFTGPNPEFEQAIQSALSESRQ